MQSATLAAGRRTKWPVLNDIHSRLNPTRVGEVLEVDSLAAVQAAVERSAIDGRPISVAGGRHAMGGQQLGTATRHIDTRPLARVLDFDPTTGLIEVEAGIRWPDLIARYLELQEGRPGAWGIAQKQTGADRLSVGGAVAANAHGRGLAMRPIVADVESLLVVDAWGRSLRVSRTREPDLFRLIAGGYGLFGIVYSVTLRLVPRLKLCRVVELRRSDELIDAFADRISRGFLYGDFQFAIDPHSEDFLRLGIFSCYRPVDPRLAMGACPKELRASDWKELLRLAHVDKRAAFRRYSTHYLATSGQLYWSDTHQLGIYLDDYHRELDRELGRGPGSEIITELYVPRESLASFLEEAREDFRRHEVDLIYGTVRLIERDEETFLPWARDDYACVVFNLHTDHTPRGISRAAAAFRRLNDMALRRGGSFYLTYHRHATREQIEAAYPQFREFLRQKTLHDPGHLFQSDWYRHHVRLFGSEEAETLA